MDFANFSAGAGVFFSSGPRTLVGYLYIGNFTLFNKAYDNMRNVVRFNGSDYLSPFFILSFIQASFGNDEDDIELSVPIQIYDPFEWDYISNVIFAIPSTTTLAS